MVVGVVIVGFHRRASLAIVITNTKKIVSVPIGVVLVTHTGIVARPGYIFELEPNRGQHVLPQQVRFGGKWEFVRTNGGWSIKSPHGIAGNKQSKSEHGD